MRTPLRLALTLVASAAILATTALPAQAAPSPTDLVADITPGTGDGYPYELTEFNGRLYFGALEGAGYELFVSDGTIGSATNLNLNPTGPSDPTGFTVIGNTLYFSATNGSDGEELWAITGSGLPAMVADIEPGAGDSDPNSFTLFNGKVYFQASNSLVGQSLFVLSAGTVSQYPVGTLSGPGDFFVYNGLLYMSFFGPDGVQLYSIDGTAPPVQVALLNASNSAYPHAFAVAGGVLYFLANVNPTFPNVEYELWSYNGVTAPTQITTDLANQFGYQYFSVFNDTLYFSAGTSATGQELGHTTGGAAPTYFDINPGAANSSPSGFTAYAGSLYFSATNGVSGYELFSLTGAAAPVVRADIYPGGNSGDPYDFEVVGSRLAFAASANGTGWELWSFNGVAANQETNLYPSDDADVYFLTALNGYVYYSADSAATGTELWRTQITGSAIAPAALAATGTDAALLISAAAALLMLGAVAITLQRRATPRAAVSRLS